MCKPSYSLLIHVRAEAATLLEQHGRNELTENVTPKWLIFLQQVRLFMPLAALPGDGSQQCPS